MVFLGKGFIVEKEKIKSKVTRLDYKTPIVCLECNTRFKRKIGRKTFEIKCPKCKGYDTFPA